MFEDKYSFSQDQNRRFAKMNLTRLVFTNSKFVGVNTTLPQTQTIIDGVGVNGISIDEHAEENYLQELLKDKNKSVTEKSIEIMYHLMKNKIFRNGNKRTATLVANKYMIDNGVGLINIPLYCWDEWNKLISDYYYDNDMSKIKEWTYKVGIQGIDIFKTNTKDKQ
ncbi:Fic family protein [Ligilactobacillus salivarius]|uniref:Fic family protein n=2 Tax=Ligilactobacillus salivarius TaxID=1624 RepID=UPI0022E8318B|nr:Fic family protein [Ligilactobacillus salivarius]